MPPAGVPGGFYCWCSELFLWVLISRLYLIHIIGASSYSRGAGALQRGILSNRSFTEWVDQ